ncbi:MAG TPA: Bax inhibitor-1/YccA family protein [Ilumatobacteraceae bacterium]|nr:Bax inhibitor-1/YccA family protein [Ilumatobacteraceae bacterium]
MSNPVFNEESFKSASQNYNVNQPSSTGQAGWGAPVAGTHTATHPVTDGPVSGWQKAMTINGTITASLVLLTILLVSASFGWSAATGPVDVEGVETYQFPGMAMVGIIVGFVAVLVAMRKPNLAKILGPVYAIGYGFAVGAISKGYETFYNGIVIQAVLATASVFAVMLVLYRTRIIKVTDKFRRAVIFATLGVMVLYLGSFVFSLFGGSLPFLNGDNMALSIAFSVFVCGLAAMNLALDFDFIERATNSGMPKTYEWVAALGLVVTLVWLYLELLRLLSYLRN